MSEATVAPGRRLSEIRQQMGMSQRRVAELGPDAQRHQYD